MTAHLAPCAACGCTEYGCRGCLHEPSRTVHVLGWRPGCTVVRSEAEELLDDEEDPGPHPRASVAAGTDDLSPVYCGPAVEVCAMCATGARHTTTAHEEELSADELPRAPRVQWVTRWRDSGRVHLWSTEQWLAEHNAQKVNSEMGKRAVEVATYLPARVTRGELALAVAAAQASEDAGRTLIEESVRAALAALGLELPDPLG